MKRYTQLGLGLLAITGFFIGIVFFLKIFYQQRYEGLVDQFLTDYYFAFFPSRATAMGLHQYDQALEDYSQTTFKQQSLGLKRLLAKFTGIHAWALSLLDRSDREYLISYIQDQLLDLNQIRNWQKDPDFYTSNTTNSIFVLISRDFAPLEQRLKAVIAREQAIPKVLNEARANLHNPPSIYTQIALEQLPGIIRFFAKDIPKAFQPVKDKTLYKAFVSSNQRVIQALHSYQRWLQGYLLAHSHGDFRIGEENYRKKLHYAEMVDIPLTQLLAIGYADLKQNQQQLREIAFKINPHLSPRSVLNQLGQDHPKPEQLLAYLNQVVSDVKDFVIRRHIISLPQAGKLIIQETPPFLQALTFASMDVPGPYEKTAKEAFFNVTLPQKHWPAKKTAEFMAAFNRGTITSTAIHEVYPGHYTQFLWMPYAPTKIRRLLGANTNAEGWAHYCEQMLLDEGYAKDDLKVRLGQIQDALLRDARFIVGIKMHTGQMSFKQGVDFFVREGYQTQDNALRETKRGTSDPTYLVYTLGKLQILKLRDDYKRLKGSDFRLQAFHDRFIQQGYLPITLVRRALLNE